jgi:hypothetical protein
MSSDLLKQFKAMSREVPDSKFTLPGSGQDIYFVPFTTKDQKALLKSMEKEDYELVQEAFDTILKKCVTNDGFDPKSLYPKDREALLVELRKESVNQEYTHSWVCQNEVDELNEDGEVIGKKICGTENSIGVSLDDLNLKSLGVNQLKKTVELDDKQGCHLLLDMAKRRDEIQVMAYTKKNSNGVKGLSKTELLYATLASFIEGIKIGDEESKDLSLEDRISIIDDLTIRDRNKIQDFLTELEGHGYDLTLDKCVCKSCGHVKEETLEWVYFFAV